MIIFFCSKFKVIYRTFTQKDQSKLNYRIGQRRSDSVIKLVSDLITELDQAVRLCIDAIAGFFLYSFYRNKFSLYGVGLILEGLSHPGK